MAISDSEIYKRHFELEKSNLFKKIILDISKNISLNSYKLSGEVLLTMSKVAERPSKVLQNEIQDIAKTVIDNFLKEIQFNVDNYSCSVSEHNKTVTRALLSIAINPHDIVNSIKYLDEYLEINFNFSSSDFDRIVYLRSNYS